MRNVFGGDHARWRSEKARNSNQPGVCDNVGGTQPSPTPTWTLVASPTPIKAVLTPTKGVTPVSGSCDDMNWFCLGECASSSVRLVFGNNAASWRTEKARNSGKPGACDTVAQNPTTAPTPQGSPADGCLNFVSNIYNIPDGYCSVGGGKMYVCDNKAWKVDTERCPANASFCIGAGYTATQYPCCNGLVKNGINKCVIASAITPTPTTRIWPTVTPTSVLIPTNTKTPTPTPTILVARPTTVTQQPTATSTPRPTVTSTPTKSPTPSPTRNIVLPTQTSTPTKTPTPLLTRTPVDKPNLILQNISLDRDNNIIGTFTAENITADLPWKEIPIIAKPEGLGPLGTSAVLQVAKEKKTYSFKINNGCPRWQNYCGVIKTTIELDYQNLITESNEIDNVRILTLDFRVSPTPTLTSTPIPTATLQPTRTPTPTPTRALTPTTTTSPVRLTIINNFLQLASDDKKVVYKYKGKSTAEIAYMIFNNSNKEVEIILEQDIDGIALPLNYQLYSGFGKKEITLNPVIVIDNQKVILRAENASTKRNIRINAPLGFLVQNRGSLTLQNITLSQGIARGQQILREEDAYIFVQDRSSLSLTDVIIDGSNDGTSCAPVDSAAGGCFEKGLTPIYSVLSTLYFNNVTILNSSWDGLTARLSGITGQNLTIKGRNSKITSGAGLVLLSATADINNLIIRDRIKSLFIHNFDNAMSTLRVNGGEIRAIGDDKYISYIGARDEGTSLQLNNVNITGGDLLLPLYAQDKITNSTITYAPFKTFIETNTRWAGPFDSTNPIMDFTNGEPSFSNVTFKISKKVEVNKLFNQSTLQTIKNLLDKSKISVEFIDKYYTDL